MLLLIQAVFGSNVRAENHINRTLLRLRRLSDYEVLPLARSTLKRLVSWQALRSHNCQISPWSPAEANVSVGVIPSSQRELDENDCLILPSPDVGMLGVRSLKAH